mgnify:CR=1 FL=1
MMSYGKEYVSVRVGADQRQKIEELKTRYEAVMGVSVKRHFILKMLVEKGLEHVGTNLDDIATTR